MTASMVGSDALPEGGALTTLKRTVAECEKAFNDPSDWSHHIEFGLFRHGSRVPERISALMRQFSKKNHDPFAVIDEIAWDRGVFLSAVTQLIDARHAVAHALPDGLAPSPKDAQAWLVLSFWLVRRLDHFVVTELSV